MVLHQIILPARRISSSITVDRHQGSGSPPQIALRVPALSHVGGKARIQTVQRPIPASHVPPVSASSFAVVPHPVRRPILRPGHRSSSSSAGFHHRRPAGETSPLPLPRPRTRRYQRRKVPCRVFLRDIQNSAPSHNHTTSPKIRPHTNTPSQASEITVSIP